MIEDDKIIKLYKDNIINKIIIILQVIMKHKVTKTSIIIK